MPVVGDNIFDKPHPTATRKETIRSVDNTFHTLAMWMLLTHFETASSRTYRRGHAETAAGNLLEVCEMYLPDLYSVLPRYHTIWATGFAFDTTQVSVRSWPSRTSTLALRLWPCISIDDGGAREKRKRREKNEIYVRQGVVER